MLSSVNWCLQRLLEGASLQETRWARRLVGPTSAESVAHSSKYKDNLRKTDYRFPKTPKILEKLADI
ncbi:hypothetical protein B5X24_HaOG216433 [Helicoverpa armigera]|nr:hypothetical protein B5X24_HaOG216433 [Helicoverpa armigera]